MSISSRKSKHFEAEIAAFLSFLLQSTSLGSSLLGLYNWLLGIASVRQSSCVCQSSLSCVCQSSFVVLGGDFIHYRHLGHKLEHNHASAVAIYMQ